MVTWNNAVNDSKLKTLYLNIHSAFKRLFKNAFPDLLTGIIKFWIYSVPFFNCIWSMFVLIKDVPMVAFCHRLQPATILTGLIVALTRFPELFLYAYPCITMTTLSDLETVDVSWITWVNCSFRMKARGFKTNCRELRLTTTRLSSDAYFNPESHILMINIYSCSCATLRNILWNWWWLSLDSDKRLANCWILNMTWYQPFSLCTVGAYARCSLFTTPPCWVPIQSCILFNRAYHYTIILFSRCLHDRTRIIFLETMPSLHTIISLFKNIC